MRPVDASPQVASPAADERAHEEKSLVAYFTGARPELSIVPSSRRRDWIDALPSQWANRCLPLVVANESGWTLLNPVAFEAVWTGEPALESIKIEFADKRLLPNPLVSSHFGFGVLTWQVPFIFRTPPGYNLLARGPANWPKDGISPLEGLVETDWSIVTFTMNWKLTRPNHPVTFAEGEPFCMIVPQRRGELESFRPSIAPLSDEPELTARLDAWSRKRHEQAVQKFIAQYSHDSAGATSWEGNYYRGLTPEGEPAPEHQKHLRLVEFSGFDASE